MEIKIASSNPTQLLGKEADICSSGVDVACLSETSHTVKAQKVIRSRCKRLQFGCSFGTPVPDQTTRTGGSFRGIAQGVATLSRFPIFDNSILFDVDVSLLHRIQRVVVQIQHIPIRITIVYLRPGSCDYVRALNNRLARIAVSVANASQGPSISTGDWNHAASDISPFHSLLQQDWTDVAVHYANLPGEVPAPTCMLSTRHTFQLVNPLMLRFLKSCEVLPFEAFHKHDLIVCCYDVPDSMPVYLQWRQPQKRQGDSAFIDFEASISECLRSNEADKALKLWATAAEKVFDSSCCDAEGNSVRLPAKFFGRCAPSPRQRRFWPLNPVAKKEDLEMTPSLLILPTSRLVPFSNKHEESKTCYGVQGSLMKSFKMNLRFKCDINGKQLFMLVDLVCLFANGLLGKDFLISHLILQTGSGFQRRMMLSSRKHILYAGQLGLINSKK